MANFSFTVSGVESFLSAISSIAVIAGAAFVVFQLRQNAKLIKQQEKTLVATSEANKSENAFQLIGKVVDPSFPSRRHRLYEVSKKYSGGDWAGFDQSLDDFEVRNFANIYEQMGLLVKKGVIDLQDVNDALSAQPMADWLVFQPIRKHIMEEAGKWIPSLATNQAGLDATYWPNFMWLAQETEKWVREKTSNEVSPSYQLNPHSPK